MDRASGADTTYTWDPAGRLATVTTGGSTQTRRCGPAGTLDGIDASVAADWQQLWWDLSGRDRVPQVLAWQANGVNTAFCDGDDRLGATGVWYGYDWAGSTIGVTAMGVAAPAGYDPYGVSEPAHTGTAWYGYRSELATRGDLIHLRNRDYDPTTGTFLTRDPLDGVNGTPDVANPYAYVSNDPLNHVDPLGLRKQDSDPDWKPPPPPVMQPSDCALYRTGRIGDYLYGREKPPCGFERSVYKPEQVRGFAGNALIFAGPSDRVDSCSGKILTLLSNGLLGPFNPLSGAEVERAYKEFDVSCRAHDYAYDLIRFAWKDEGWNSRVNGYSDLVRDRADADGEMREISTGVCNDAPWAAWFDVWDKFTCWKIRDLMYNGLRAWTKLEGIPK